MIKALRNEKMDRIMHEWKACQEEVDVQEKELVAELGGHAAITIGIRVDFQSVINEDS